MVFSVCKVCFNQSHMHFHTVCCSSLVTLWRWILPPNQGPTPSFERKTILHLSAQQPCWITISMRTLLNLTLCVCYRGYETQNKPPSLLLRNSRGVFFFFLLSDSQRVWNSVPASAWSAVRNLINVLWMLDCQTAPHHAMQTNRCPPITFVTCDYDGCKQHVVRDVLRQKSNVMLMFHRCRTNSFYFPPQENTFSVTYIHWCVPWTHQGK